VQVCRGTKEKERTNKQTKQNRNNNKNQKKRKGRKKNTTYQRANGQTYLFHQLVTIEVCLMILTGVNERTTPPALHNSFRLPCLYHYCYICHVGCVPSSHMHVLALRAQIVDCFHPEENIPCSFIHSLE
jgi:hypothetical protein